MKRIALLAAAVFVASAAVAAEFEEGRLELILDEPSSRFLLNLESSGTSIPLLYAEDARTSGLDIREGNRVYRMGDSGEFRQVAEETDEGIFYVWTSATLRVSQRFRFIRSVGGSEIDGVQMNIAITNLGEQATPVAARLLLDTYLGERGNAHFSTPLAQQITRETELEPSTAQSYVRSGSPQESDGLQIMIAGSEITTPKQVALANWKRLADSEWVYVVNSDRNFNRLPYSINDSAVLMTWEEQVLNQNERYEVVTQLGAFAADGYLPPGSSQTLDDDAVAELLGQLADLIDQIDALIANPEATIEQVAELRRQLEMLSAQFPGQ